MSLGGYGAGAMTQGFMEGFKFIEDMADQRQNRRIRNQQALQAARQRAVQYEAMSQAAAGYGVDFNQNPEVAALNQQLQGVQKRQARIEGDAFRDAVNYANANPNDPNRVRRVQHAASAPSVAQAMGVDDPSQIRPVDKNNPIDLDKARRYYIQTNPQASLLQGDAFERGFNKWLKHAWTDGKSVVHGPSLGMAIGANKVADRKETVAGTAQTKPVASKEAVTEGKPPMSAEHPALSGTQGDVEQLHYATPRQVPRQEASKYVGQPGYKNVAVAKNALSLAPHTRQFYNDFAAYMKQKHGIDVMVPALGAGRTKEDQAKLYAKGRTAPGRKVTWTMNSHHIGGNAADIISSKGYKAKKENDLIAQEMRNFAKNNPQYGASFLSMNKDPNHVQFTGQGGGSIPQTAPASASHPALSGDAGMMSQPYSSNARQAFLERVAGLGDSRPAMARQMDYIAQQLGPGATLQDVMNVHDAWQSAGQTAGTGLTKQYQTAVYAAGQQMEQDFGPDWKTEMQNSPEMQERYRNLMERANAVGMGGFGESREVNDVSAVGTNLALARKDRDGTAEVSQEVIDAAKQREYDAGLDKRQWYKDLDKSARALKKPYKESKDLLAEIDEIPPEELFRGPVDQWKTWASSYVPEVGEAWSDKDLENFNKTVKVNTKLKMLMSDYIKSVSGMAVTDAERQMFMDLLQAADSKNPAALKAALSSFNSVIKNRGITVSRDMAKRGAYGSGKESINYFMDRALGTKPAKAPTAAQQNKQQAKQEAQAKQPPMKDAIHVETVQDAYKAAEAAEDGTIFYIRAQGANYKKGVDNNRPALIKIGN